MTDKIEEIVADAIDAARYAHPEHPRERPLPFSEADKSDREYAMRLARAAIHALSSSPAQGVPEDWKLTPRELNEVMRQVAWGLLRNNLRPDEIWKYMWDAAPAPLSSAIGTERIHD